MFHFSFFFEYNRQEQKSARDYEVMKLQQERAKARSVGGVGNDRNRGDSLGLQPQNRSFPRETSESTLINRNDTNEPETKSSKDRSGTPKRISQPERKLPVDGSQLLQPTSLSTTTTTTSTTEPDITFRSDSKSISQFSERLASMKYTPSEERIAELRRHGLMYYSGELMTVEEAESLKRALKDSMQNGRNGEEEVETEEPIVAPKINNFVTKNGDIKLGSSPLLSSPLQSTPNKRYKLQFLNFNLIKILL